MSLIHIGKMRRFSLVRHIPRCVPTFQEGKLESLFSKMCLKSSYLSPNKIQRCHYSTSDVPNSVSFSMRSHTCGSLTSSHIGQEVEIAGWLQNVRMGQFLVLGDYSGTIQVVNKHQKG